MKKFNKLFFNIIKGTLWLALAVTVSILSIIFGMKAFGWSEHPLGLGLYICANFSKTIAYDVILSSESGRLEYIVPTQYSNAYDTISGRRKESVQSVIRYPDHLTITVVDLIDGSKRYFLISKDFDTDDISSEEVIENHLYESFIIQ